MNSKELFYFAAQCLTLDDYPEFREAIIKGFSSGKTPVNTFIQLCDKNLVLPSIYSKFKSHNLLYLFPSQITDLLEYIYELNYNRNITILEQINEINVCLAKEDILPIYLKGAAHLLDKLYTDPGERMLGDIDFLVKEEDFYRTAQMLMGLGYAKQYELLDHMTNFKHFPPLFKDELPAVVEIHRIPVDFNYTKQFSSSQIFEQPQTIQQKMNCFIPSDKHMIIHNVIHSQLSNLEFLLKEYSLRDMYDLYLLSKKMSPGDVIQDMEHRKEAKAYLAVTEKVFNVHGLMHIEIDRKQRFHCLVVDFLLKNHNIHQLYKTSIRTFRLVFISFKSKIAKAIRVKSYRKHIIEKYILHSKNQ